LSPAWKGVVAFIVQALRLPRTLEASRVCSESALPKLLP